MSLLRSFILALATLFSMLSPAAAQNNAALNIATVHRPPFAFTDDNDVRGFSIDLMRAIGEDIGREITFQPEQDFRSMFDKVISNEVDGAIANISITTEREQAMDFSQPIFASGVKILLPNEASQSGPLSALFTWDIGIIVLSGLALLMLGGLLMWALERKHQPYFDKSAKEAMFPSFWWALNLVVNGGFEERVPRSPLGRVFAVMLVVSSLFIVSIFVASITAATTVTALSSNVQSLRDLERRQIGTIQASTSVTVLANNGLGFTEYATPDDMFAAFESGDINALVFDGPILAYYQQTRGAGKARLLQRTYRPESYGIVLPTGSGLKEEIDQVLLKLKVDGTYDALLVKWFGNTYTPD